MDATGSLTFISDEPVSLPPSLKQGQGDSSWGNGQACGRGMMYKDSFLGCL